MGAVKSSIPETQKGVDQIIDDIASKIAQKELDLEAEKGNENRNMESIVTLKIALQHMKNAKAQLESYKAI
jgi:predicted  nucleic acid-binding Zn-ribbon protein